MPDRCRIVNLIQAGVRLDDLGVLLPGKGSEAVVLAATASASADLRRARELRWVSIAPVRVAKEMPVWPFISEQKPASRPESAGGIESVLRNIDSKLGELLRRPMPAPPEVVAAHVRSISSMPAVPAGLPGGGPLPGPGAASHPQFIPSVILPDESEFDSRIQPSVEEVEAPSLDEGVAALKRMRRGR